MPRFTVATSARLLAMTIGISMIGGTAQAGFLDTLFGRPAQPIRQFEPESNPLSVTVTKRARPRKATAPAVAPPVVLQKSTLDPSKDPHWYLKDDTLRRGDLVVLDNRVLRFRDTRPSGRADAFEDIRDSGNLSKRERERILAMIQHRGGPMPQYKIITEPAAPVATTMNRLDRANITVIMP